MAATTQEPPANELRPLLLIHRLPHYNLSFPFLQTRYRILDPLNESDPSYTALSKSARVMLCVGLSPVTSDTLDRYPALECIVGSTAGYDHIDVSECRRRGIRVTGAGDTYSDDVADFAVGLLIDVLRRITVADSFIRSGSWRAERNFPLSSKVGGKRVGIVGLGSIGLRVSKRLHAMGCTIAYTSKSIKPNVPYSFYENTSDLAAECDVLIPCCTLTHETRHIIDKKVMLALGKNGVIINVGRGGLIDETEMVSFLVRGELGGAGLDVYENEPNVPKELFRLDNVVLSSHASFATQEAMSSLQMLVATNIDSFFSNEPLLAEVNYPY
ncbi:unnamed protein product [Cuscuta epithymum]|uniref:Uncharacterized protein n=1 Tax=Cuscuta epithymum TaxID=186058 RepID=A0AAV0G9Y1_9ASTE|nr:unnamed protein product [Cuscuta epithymum]